MPLIAVLDVRDGHVVAGHADLKRGQYAERESVWTGSTHPLGQAWALHQWLGLRHFYLADLDALAGERFRPALVASMVAQGWSVMVDAGLRTARDARHVARTGAQVVVGSETLESLDDFHDILKQIPASQLIFSLDLRAGKVISPIDEWKKIKPLKLVKQLHKAGVRQLLVLDLSHIGTNQGPTTKPLLEKICRACPRLQLYTGGGWRNPLEIPSLLHLGVAGVLMGQALHGDRQLARDMVACFQKPSRPHGFSTV